MIYLQTSHQYILVPELLIWALKPFWLLLLAPAVCQCDSSSVPVWHQKCAGRGKFADTGTTAPPLCHPAASTQRKTFHLLNFSYNPLLPPNNVSGICFVAFLAAALEPSWTSDQAIKLLLPFPMTYSGDIELLLKTNVSQNLKSRWSFLALIVTSSQKSFSTDFVETWRMFEATLGRITKL